MKVGLNETRFEVKLEVEIRAQRGPKIPRDNGIFRKGEVRARQTVEEGHSEVATSRW